jgi:hypothetical protein
MRRPTPKARGVIFRPGAACLRLYSLRSTLRATSLTTASGSPARRGRGGEAFLDVALEDGVEHVVGRQAVLVGLVGAQLGARGLSIGLGNRGMISARRAVDPAGERVDLRLEDVGDHGEAAAHVAVERAVADGHSLLLPVVSRSAPNLLESAIIRTPRTRAWMFSSVTSRGRPAKTGPSEARRRRRRRRCDGLETDAEVFGEGAGVVARVLARNRGGQGDADDVLRAECLGGDHGDERRVDAAESATRALS